LLKGVVSYSTQHKQSNAFNLNGIEMLSWPYMLLFGVSVVGLLWTARSRHRRNMRMVTRMQRAPSIAPSVMPTTAPIDIWLPGVDMLPPPCAQVASHVDHRYNSIVLDAV
jgi:hypothetical protein